MRGMLDDRTTRKRNHSELGAGECEKITTVEKTEEYIHTYTTVMITS